MRLRYDNSATRDNGSVLVRGFVDDNDTQGGLEENLLAGNVTLTVTDGLSPFSATVHLTGCEEVKPGTGKIRCKSYDPKIRAKFNPTKQGPFLYNVVVRVVGLGAAVTGNDQPSGPQVDVGLVQGGVARLDEIGDVDPCQQSGSTGLVCRER